MVASQICSADNGLLIVMLLWCVMNKKYNFWDNYE